MWSFKTIQLHMITVLSQNKQISTQIIESNLITSALGQCNDHVVIFLIHNDFFLRDDAVA